MDEDALSRLREAKDNFFKQYHLESAWRGIFSFCRFDYGWGGALAVRISSLENNVLGEDTKEMFVKWFPAEFPEYNGFPVNVEYLESRIRKRGYGFQ